MGTFHRRVLTDLGFDVRTVDPAPGVADYQRVPRGRFDTVCISVPIANLAERAAEWVGHEGWLLVEKPFAETTLRAAVLAELLEGQRVAVGYVERFNPRVGDLRMLLESMEPEHAVFRRWNDRPCRDVRLDLISHDVDLARYLRLECSCVFDAGGDRPCRRRDVDVDGLHVDLLAHDTSPLHAMWRAFLDGQEGPAIPADAVAALRTLEGVPACA